ncbi:hypothetical protein AVEN_22699-1 [Araneus ventricosus]|uniref:Uncharacterized protein n=1 Tax=Araneus ventricosus TaxID=182803 RepID=A0A4Y2SVG1_ARAVE|nr:hypothetical protein AVEN_80168-1 [Araneus ventricosus]GBN90865.1 hypothetical protein AVEN_22699-1 [Araneus ventricosus]
MVVWLFGPISEDRLYPGYPEDCCMGARNGGYFAGTSVPEYDVVAASLSDLPGCFCRKGGCILMVMVILMLKGALCEEVFEHQTETDALSRSGCE